MAKYVIDRWLCDNKDCDFVFERTKDGKEFAHDLPPNWSHVDILWNNGSGSGVICPDCSRKVVTTVCNMTEKDFDETSYSEPKEVKNAD